jgi:hypothetical protein
MTKDESPGFLHRMMMALGSALKRAILGRSTHAYMKQFSGSDEYWDRVIAAQLGWPQKQPPKPDPDRVRNSGDAVVPVSPSVRGNGPSPPESDYEPVHGWTKRQFDDYLTRNPGYRSSYEAELQKRRSTVAPGVNGSCLDWFDPRRIDHDKAACNTKPNGTKQTGKSPTDPLCGL